jgi:hypothetical protein
MPTTDPSVTLPFGPYQGHCVDEVAIIDPAYLAALVRNEVGPPELRAAAAKVLLDPDLAISASALRPSGSAPPQDRRTVQWVLGLGIAGAVALGLADAVGGLPGFTPSQASAVPTVRTPLSTLAAPTSPARASRAAPGSGTGVADAAVGTRQSQGSTVTPPGRTVVAPFPDGSADACAARVPGAVTAEQAAALVDTFQAVAFDVVGTKDTGKVTFLNSHQPYQSHFYVAVFPTLYDQFPAPPAQYFKDKCVVVQGQVALYRGTPQLVVQTVDDIRVVDGP